MNYKESTLIVEKIFWSLFPLAWGCFTWFMSWGPGSSLIPYFPLNYLMRTVAALAVTTYFFGASLQDKSKKYTVQFFGYCIWLPSWLFFMVLTVVASCLTPLIYHGFLNSSPYNDFFSSLIYGVILSSILEEFVTRSFFIKYTMRPLEFLFFNVISSFTFMYMHNFYVHDGVALHTLLQNGHFIFSFTLGLIAYKTQRIEVPILLHMLSNLLRYTVPVCVFNCPWPSLIALAGSMVVDTVTLAILAGCTYKEKK